MTAPDSAGATQEHTGAEAAISEAIHLLSTTNDTALPEEAQALVKRAINLLEQAEETFLEAPAIKTYRVLAYHVYEVDASSEDSALEVTTDLYLARDFTENSVASVQLEVTEKDTPPLADFNTWWK